MNFKIAIALGVCPSLNRTSDGDIQGTERKIFFYRVIRSRSSQEVAKCSSPQRRSRGEGNVHASGAGMRGQGGVR